MSEPVTTGVAVGVVTGAAAIPVFTVMGLAPEDMLYALLGCIVAQCLLPAENRKLVPVFFWTLGSVLMSGLLTPVVAPVVVSKFAEQWPTSQVPLHGLRILVAAGLGVFAQPLLLLARRLFRRKADALEKEAT